MKVFLVAFLGVHLSRCSVDLSSRKAITGNNCTSSTDLYRSHLSASEPVTENDKACSMDLEDYDLSDKKRILLENKENFANIAKEALNVDILNTAGDDPMNCPLYIYDMFDVFIEQRKYKGKYRSRVFKSMMIKLNLFGSDIEILKCSEIAYFGLVSSFKTILDGADLKKAIPGPTPSNRHELANFVSRAFTSLIGNPVTVPPENVYAVLLLFFCRICSELPYQQSEIYKYFEIEREAHEMLELDCNYKFLFWRPMKQYIYYSPKSGASDRFKDIGKTMLEYISNIHTPQVHSVHYHKYLVNEAGNWAVTFSKLCNEFQLFGKSVSGDQAKKITDKALIVLARILSIEGCDVTLFKGLFEPESVDTFLKLINGLLSWSLNLKVCLDNISDDDNDENDGDLKKNGIGKQTKLYVVNAPKPPPRPDLPPVIASAYKKAREVGEQIEARIASLLNVTAFSRHDPIAALTAKYKPASQSAFGEIIPVYDPKTISNSLALEYADTPRLFICEVEINEYPQPARLKVTHRDTISGIIDAAGGSGIIVVVRGQYIPPNRQIKEGERKLYIRIEGETQHSVEVARSEIRRILLDAITNASIQ